MLKFLLVLLLAVVLPYVADAAISCLDESGKPVDWFVIYKMPVITDFSKGYNYMYADSNLKKPLKLSDNELSDEAGAMAATLKQLYDAYDNNKTASVGWALYNDEPPGRGSPSKYGHSKGAYAFDHDTGYWLVHSVPRYPQIIKSKRRYNFPKDERVYGQTMLCMTYKFDTMDVIAHDYFRLSRPNIYSSNNPYASKMPAFTAVLDEKHSMDKLSNVAKLTSNGGVEFLAVAKTANWKNSLYEAAVAPLLDDNLIVETWMRPHMDSFCDLKKYNHTIEMVEHISFPMTGFTFKETKDHAKWCVTQSKHYLCIGDINHQKSQYHRAGGTVCFKNEVMWKSFTDAAVDIQKCS